ncbi:MAG: bifunctional methylenetetrahydrofolate dehydrogenase/methenyltetrahydrofolate cyclohydrolase FolD [Bacteroidia bacterium]|nr:bifunctional methylenetetrahydrofolate dehydrogenase/methenyltetrahydrofolate cyclohydrolase FolD [Bacteroidia bacterium]
MKAKILDGKKTAQDIRNEIKAEVDQLRSRGLRPPHLVAILVGDNPASHTYVRGKMRACAEVGFDSTNKHLPASTTEQELLGWVKTYNEDPLVDGILVQMPLPEHIVPQNITKTIVPHKDADGFHPLNVGLMTLNFPGILSATPAGIMELIDRYEIPTKGKHVVIAGRSRIVGRPISILMSRGGQPGEATVTICHRYTPPELLKQMCLQADIVIVAVGKPGLITADMIKEDAVVIDVGINRIEAPEKKSGYRLVGDVDFDAVAEKASYITPVPGGVGPMTVAMLLSNTLHSYKRSHG